jgi:hypothetical protein
VKLSQILISTAAICCTVLPAHSAEPIVASAPRASLCLNGEWEVAPGDDETKIPVQNWVAARIPAAPILDPKVTAEWCRLSFPLPKEWIQSGRRFYVEFEKVGHYAAVYCNGQKIGEHYGQYSPFEFDLSDTVHPGDANELAVYVHNASGKFVRPGVDIADEFTANAYRPAANQMSERNWVGISGDVTFSWRPQNGITSVFVDPSVRKKMLNVTVEAPADLLRHVAVTVLDSATLVPGLAPKTDLEYSKGRLTIPWGDAVLWGSPPYGEPKLYTLRTELVADGKVIDRVFTRFGFREVWIEGKDVMLNGKKLWMAGTYLSKHSPLRDLNDRRPIGALNRVMQEAGLNTVHGHWDDLGRPWMDVCDEAGMFVVAGFSCDGRPQIQSKADDGWAKWMTATCAEWARGRRNHPSILLWRPTDVPPPQLQRFISPDDFHTALDAEVRNNDPSHRPIADGSDIAAWGQPPEDKATGEFTNFAQLDNGPQGGKPFMCKEIYGGFNAPEKYAAFVQEYYRRSFQLGSTGMLVQQLPLLRFQGPKPFRISWLSASGPGNRDTAPGGIRGELPNWCDAEAPAAAETPYAKLFRDLFQQYMHVVPAAAPAAEFDLLAKGLTPKSPVFLVPEDSTTAEPHGLMTAADGSAWLFVPAAGDWRLVQGTTSIKVRPPPPSATSTSGYSAVQHTQAAP